MAMQVNVTVVPATAAATFTSLISADTATSTTTQISKSDVQVIGYSSCVRTISFYPRDATLRYASAGRPTSRGPVSVCLSVCLSQVIVLSKWVNELSCFGMVASLYPSYTVLKGNSAISNNKYTSLWNFAPNCGL